MSSCLRRRARLLSGMNFPEPFSYRFCGNPARILSARNVLAGARRGPRRQPRAGTDMDVIGNPDLSSQHRKILDDGAAADAHLGDQHAMAADLHIMADLHQIIDLAAFANHRIADSSAIDGRVRRRSRHRPGQ